MRWLLVGLASFALAYDAARAPQPSANPPATINPEDYGADPSGRNDSSAAVQKAIDAANGACLSFPVGQFQFHGITSSKPVCVYGAGTGAGPGPGAQSNANVTQFLLNSSTSDLFTITSVYPSVFHDFQVNVPPADRPMTAGSAIHLIGTGRHNVASYEITHVGFTNVFNPISVVRGFWGKIDHNYFDTWGGHAISLTTSLGVEGGGGYVTHNEFYGLSTTTTAPIYSEVGYTIIDGNEILGGPECLWINLKYFNAGFFKFFNNSCENYGVQGVLAETSDGSRGAEFDFNHNEFSDLANSQAYTLVILEYPVSPMWLTGLNITDNIDNTSSVHNGKHFWIQAGMNVQIGRNQINELGSSPDVIGIQVKGATTDTGLVAPINVFDNAISGSAISSANRYKVTTVSVIRDLQGLPFADLPAALGNGSQIFVTDGTAGRPCAGRGKGAMAFRENGSYNCF